jgi:hypothetical protein
MLHIPDGLYPAEIPRRAAIKPEHGSSFEGVMRSSAATWYASGTLNAGLQRRDITTGKPQQLIASLNESMAMKPSGSFRVSATALCRLKGKRNLEGNLHSAP